MQESLVYLQKTLASLEVAKALQVAVVTVGIGEETVKKVALLAQTQVVEAAPKAPLSLRPLRAAQTSPILEKPAQGAAAKAPSNPILENFRAVLKIMSDQLLFIPPRDPTDPTKLIFVPFENREGLFPYETLNFSFNREMCMIKNTPVAAYIEEAQTLLRKENAGLKKVFDAAITQIDELFVYVLKEINKEKSLEEHTRFCQEQRKCFLKLIRTEDEVTWGLTDDLNFAMDRLTPWFPLAEVCLAKQKALKNDASATEIPFPNLLTGGVIRVRKSAMTWKWEQYELRKFYVEYRQYLLLNYSFLNNLIRFTVKLIGLLETFPGPYAMSVGVKTGVFTPDLEYINRCWKAGKLPDLPSSYPEGHFKLPDNLKLLRHPESKKQESKAESKTKA